MPQRQPPLTSPSYNPNTKAGFCLFLPPRRGMVAPNGGGESLSFGGGLISRKVLSHQRLNSLA